MASAIGIHHSYTTPVGRTFVGGAGAVLGLVMMSIAFLNSCVFTKSDAALFKSLLAP